MNTKKLDERGLMSWVEALIGDRCVIGPQAEGGRFAFKRLTKAADLRLDYDVTKLPPKQFFQPPCEEMLRFDSQGRWESVLSEDPFVLFGVHPYDLAAISQMDRLFAEGNYDAHYMARRKNAVLVACDVQTASPNVFAGCMSTATVDSGFDVRITKVGAAYVVEPGTDKGRDLMAAIAGAPDADAESLARREQVWECNRRLLRRHVLRLAPSDLPALLERSFDHPVWERRAERCYSCGSCNLVCPTCYCFDVRDDVNWDLKSGVRTRSWDGCMLAGFAAVAGGHNFRARRADRYRHRFYRKGKYVPAKIGEIACVGCGRCISACTAAIANPVEVYNALLEVT